MVENYRWSLERGYKHIGTFHKIVVFESRGFTLLGPPHQQKLVPYKTLFYQIVLKPTGTFGSSGHHTRPRPRPSGHSKKGGVTSAVVANN